MPQKDFKTQLFVRSLKLEEHNCDSLKHIIKTDSGNIFSLETVWNKEGTELVNLEIKFKSIDFRLADKIAEVILPFLEDPQKQLELPFEVEVKNSNKTANLEAV